jgi:hypothetical protein
MDIFIIYMIVSVVIVCLLASLIIKLITIIIKFILVVLKKKKLLKDKPINNYTQEQIDIVELQEKVEKLEAIIEELEKRGNQ